MKKILLTFMLLVGIVSSAWAQVDDVTLFVSAEGATKEEAITRALRSAIEQTFGVFVSANTEILNDELVKDEIATVTSGNIKRYEEISTIDLPNGQKVVQIKAVVSTTALTSYARGKGSKCEFAGALFGQNIKLAELNKENSETAIYNLFVQLDKIIPYMFNYKVDVKNATVTGDVSLNIKVSSHTTETNSVYQLIQKTIEGISIPSGKVKEMESMGLKTFQTHCFGKDYYLYTQFPWSDIKYIIAKAFYMRLSHDQGGEYYIAPQYDPTSYIQNDLTLLDHSPGNAGGMYIFEQLVSNPNLTPLLVRLQSYQDADEVPDNLNRIHFPLEMGYGQDVLSGIYSRDIEIKIKIPQENLVKISQFSIEHDTLLRSRPVYKIKNRKRPYGGERVKIQTPSGHSLICEILPPYSVNNPQKELYGVIVEYATNDISGTLTIPSRVSYKGKQYPVVGIRKWAFKNCDKIKKIVLPNTVKIIYEEAFMGCTALEEIIISSNLKSIGARAFKYCKSLKQINLSDSKIPDGDYLGREIFYGCLKLESVSLPANFKNIHAETLSRSHLIFRDNKLIRK